MTNEYIYRYTSFESFVGLVQKQALTFVLLSKWDDPMEGSAVKYLFQNKDTQDVATLLTLIHNKIYAQSWSRVEESDAMWRIYSYANHSIRIKISIHSVSKLDGVEGIDVDYLNFPLEKDYLKSDMRLKAFAQKRTAFSHEKEYRLIKPYRYNGDYDISRHFKALIALNEPASRYRILNELFPDLPMEEQVDELIKILNIGKNAVETNEVSFRHIPNFIKGVMVHPFAEEWYVEVVKDFCKINNIPFEGKSNLYAD